jgi:uncharacterized protein (DUF58 family)
MTPARSPGDPLTRTPGEPWLRWFENWRPPRKLRITREGKYFLGITFGVGIAAINTANNLLYLLLGLLLSLVVISSIMSESTLRGLQVTRRLPRRAQVGRSHQVEIEVHNSKRRVSSYAIEIEDVRFGQPADKRCFFLKISPQSTQIAAYRRTPARRGITHHRGFRVATRFPFGFFEKSLEIDLAGTLLVYPQVDPMVLQSEGPRGTSNGERVHVRGHGDEIMGLRPMRDGDDPRDIYWRRSTQPDQRLLRIRAQETNSDINLTVNNITDSSYPADKWLEKFERQIRDIASNAVAHLLRGDTVRICSTTGASVLSTPASGADGALTFLALLDSTSADEAPVHRSYESTDSPNDETTGAVGPAPISAPPSKLARRL